MSSSNSDYNTKHLVPIHSHYVKLSQEIDDADWMGEDDTVEFLRKEQEHIKKSMDNGEVWYPLF